MQETSLIVKSNETKDSVKRSIQLLDPIDPNIHINNTKHLFKKYAQRFRSPKPLLNTQVQVNKKSPDVITVGRTDGIVISANKDPVIRVAQLEQNIRFLQEQHQSMLSCLHNEIETLRQRNRDLQFQLVFAKNGVILSSPSSPEDDPKPRILLSPKQVNVTPLQVELLEKELGELKINLQEANTKNSYLSAIVDEQKKKLETFEADWNEVQTTTSANQHEDSELQQKLEDADRLIRRLRRDNEDQRREISSLRSSIQSGDHPQQQQYGGRGNNGRRGQHHRGQRDHRFPPLHSQSYWHQSNGRGGRGQNRSDRGENEGSGGGTILPSLRSEESSQTYGTYSNHSGNGNRRSSGNYQGNGNHQYRDGGERKYRGQNNRGNKS